MRYAVLLVAASLAMAKFGCDKSHQAECDALIRQVNVDLEKIEKYDPVATESEAEAVQTLGDLATRYDELSAKVGTLSLGIAELKTQASSYQKLAEQAAATSRRLAEAIGKRDSAGQKSAEQDFERIAEEQQELVAKINAFCGR